MSTEVTETWLDDEAWSASRDELFDWLRQRGWSDNQGVLEYPPSRPPCLITVVSPMANPCKPTTIDTELSVYPPLVEFALDGREDIYDDSPKSWKYTDTPSEREVTGGPELSAAADVVTSMNVGEEDPSHIRDMIDMIEGWRWPHTLPSKDDPWVQFWEPGYPAGLDDAEAALATQGWQRSVHLTEGDVLSRGTICWRLANPKAKYGTVITVSSSHLGYQVSPPMADSVWVNYPDTAALLHALGAVERWTPDELPRWAFAKPSALLEAACPDCAQPAGQRCTSALEPSMSAVHASRVPERLTAVHVPAAKPRPGQRPVNARRSKKR
ncbi:hypothetical protein GA0074692_0811 [Micromonospora pallida]|uniref:Uncharacterized protein n=1 Tax=Micromonospora pallida TaxID=145854 RepID=A0A1C6RSR4_9ACTN|nr:hypothetical protein [Micromonospora pallida]SCL20220.1 hypothetical protein GA0074692_0811 [Micromonospora pallida]